MSLSPEITGAFPPPAIPLSPVISNLSFKLRPSSSVPSLLDVPHKLYVTSGRAAISLALEHAGIGSGDDVLVPAFHCESMISPVHWRKATPVFYQIRPDTQIDLEDIKQRHTDRCKAIIATHYFGFMQDFQPLRQWCDENGIVFIEDCAHAFFGKSGNLSAGQSGDYAIASSMKFFPIYDGGILTSSRHTLENIPLRKPSWSVDTKVALNTLERSISYKRLGVFGWLLQKGLLAKNLLWQYLKSTTNIETKGPSSSEGAYGLDEQWIHVATTRTSSKLLKHSDSDRIAHYRRRNYQILDAALGQLPGVRPLFSSLPENCVPLVYPLYIEQPERHFRQLKELGIPIWRFGEFLDPSVTEQEFPHSKELSRHIFQFPCHQELLNRELDWMIQNIQASLTNEPQGEPHGLESVPHQRVC
ncbi:DegT/DnrJ/EryC1/StrS family aminotransferase [Pseudomaricurvus sp.]|uniref:DegT/DnrJ/EryC1/StrS family aminotransferase n=1 Tax=Pseudomaricurvus sp. TaxID=2004510 RepID=UPI003F6D3312